MQNRFGRDYVCAVGTYTTMKPKAAMKDLYRQDENNYDYINDVTAVMPKVGVDNITDFFKIVAKEPKLRGFVKNFPHVIDDMVSICGQPRSRSIHACAHIIFPQDKTMFHWTPMRREGDLMVSEFEGGELDMMGFLKQDLLKIKQLDKFTDILKLIKANKGVSVDIHNLPLDDETVYKYFRKGWTGDIFQFKTKGLMQFCKSLKPRNINDLIAGVALYRPGAMENKFHETYVKRKNGQESVNYLWGSEEITKKTYGLYVYQEQISQLCVEVGGLTPAEADSVRSALGKKKLKVLLKWKVKFLEGAIKNGCPDKTAEGLWSMMEEFAKYSFNLSHSACYAITGYNGQWLKVKYPIEYWATAFKYADKEKDIPTYLSEIDQTGDVHVLPPDINESDLELKTNFKDNSIYWGFYNIKYAGGSFKKGEHIGGLGVIQIYNERMENGMYTSFENFLERNIYKGNKVTKTVAEALIISGSFDRLESLKKSSERFGLIEKYRNICKVKVNKRIDKFQEQRSDWWWTVIQKQYSGIAFFDYRGLTKEYLRGGSYVDSSFFNGARLDGSKRVVSGGFVDVVDIRSGKRGDYCKLILENNYGFIPVTIWSDVLEKYRKEIEGNKRFLILLSGDARYDDRQKRNVIHSNSKTQIVILK